MRLLRSFHFRAEAFGSAKEFLRSAFLGKAACLMLDMRMPGIDGLELQQQLMEMGQRIPIIFLSGQASEEERNRAELAGAVGFLCKPASERALLCAINAALESRLNCIAES